MNKYAERIYNDLLFTFAKHERDRRELLQEKINQKFDEIYNGTLVISIDQDYHISVMEKTYNTVVEGSTGQSVAAIFAFITAILELNREIRDSKEEYNVNASDIYPLVMDAPLSSFDSSRIENGCKSIPNSAEQVIIFIKDTDGEIAEKHMMDKIGVKLKLEKIDDLESHLVA